MSPTGWETAIARTIQEKKDKVQERKLEKDLAVEVRFEDIGNFRVFHKPNYCV